MIGVRPALNWLQRLCVSSLFAILVYPAAASATVLLPPIPPHPDTPTIIRLQVPEARLPIRMSKVDVRTEVVGRAAHTRVEMVFFNPNERQLEGELQFPLLDGQIVSGFSLDINGELRAAVPVEKQKGQEVFEDVIRARVDPALLEKTQGNNYKLRVYPLPAHGSRRVVLEIDEMLPHERNYYIVYRLPLQFATTVEQLDVAVHNATAPTVHSAMGVHASMGAEHPKVAYEYENKTRSGSLVSFSRKNYAGKEILSIDYPSIGAPWIASETRDNQTYFYAELKGLPGAAVSRSAPKRIGVVWDASGSGAARDHGRELALLDAYFKALKNVEVKLVLARDSAESAQQFSIKNGDWHALRKILESVAYDGATNVAALSPPQDADLNLLFSDGLSNFGNGDFVVGDKPLFSVNASASTDLPRLRSWAEQSGGRLLDMLSITPAQAVDELTHQSAYLAGISSNRAKELVRATGYAESGAIEIAGILTEAEATIELDWVIDNGKHHRQTVQIKNVPSTTLAARRWAVLKLEQLETDYNTNRATIQRLGKQFLMVTRETSLIVLDRLEDYVRYEIVPPEALRGEYERMLAQKSSKAKSEQKRHLDEVVSKFEQNKSWWEKDFPKGDIPKPKVMDNRSGDPSAHPLTGGLPPPEYAEAMAEESIARTRRSVAAAMPPMMAAPAPEAKSVSTTGQSDTASIRLKKWEPDSPYAKRLRQASPNQRYAIYLDERPAYTSSTAFFLDAADIFIERGQVELGVRILSNLAEMNLENRHILRILAYRLLQAKQPKLALPILQRVLALSPNEPQSWRDLGLAYAEDAQYQKAADSLWEVVSRSWGRRFPDIELIALNELNAIIATAPKSAGIDTSRMDERLLKNLPLDIRAVLGWDSDNADIDLWVTDPNGEKVFYQNKLGYQGGKLSSDFTGGYGPEEFSLRNAKPGKYRVEAHFFGNHQQIVSGATTLMLRFSTGFGTAHQKDEKIILRLTGQGADVEVGTFEVKNQ